MSPQKDGPCIGLSVVILTLNEQDDICKCIDSLGSFIDSVFIVDSGSHDGTTSLAKSRGAHVYTNTTSGPFLISEQRNWALVNCMELRDWILFLDADEILTKNLRSEIISAISDPCQHFDGYLLAPEFCYWGKKVKRFMGYPNWHARLVKKATGLCFDGGVWEHFKNPSQYNIGKLSSPYIHNFNSKGLEYWIQKHNRYSTCEAVLIYSCISGNPEPLESTKNQRKRMLAARLWPFRPIAVVFYRYFYKLGFLDGYRAVLLSALFFFYECMILMKVIERLRLKTGNSL